jgi:colicin import membrane protein
MKYPYDIGKEPNLQKIAIISAVLHVLFISVVVIPLKTKGREFRSYHVKLVGPLQSRSAKPGTGPGTVASSRKKKAAPSVKVRRKLPPKKVVKEPVKADISLERMDKVKKEIARLDAINALSKSKKAREQGKKEIEIIRKNKRDEGAGGAGMPGAGALSDPNSYYAHIYEKIQSQWVYPDFNTQALELIVSIRISREGKILSQEIEQSSGNALFDRSALKALSKASPLPPPPVEMEVGLRFYL